MDVNADGLIDILSGSYSRMDQDMAGLFQVLPGLDGGGFGPAEVLNGTDGEPLIIATGDNVVGKICTRPTAVDFDGDGDLDIVSGNFEGTFWLFDGLGEGRFAPSSRQLTTDGEPLKTAPHSDPVFVDWDGDGDLDLISGSVSAVSLFPRLSDGRFGEPRELWAIEGGPSVGDELAFGEAHITAPQGSLRVWVEDLNADGRLDLLVGDSTQVIRPAEGLDEATARERLTAWDAENAALMAKIEAAGDAGWEEFSEEMDALWERRREIVDEGGVGFVWVLYQQAPSES